MKHPTHVEAQPLGPALELLAREHGFQVLYRTEILSNVRARALNGDLSTDEALQQLLRGTGLTYRYLGRRAITIIPADERSNISSSSNAGSTGPAKGGGPSSGPFRVAQTDGGAHARPAAIERKSNGKGTARQSTLQEVVVTGTSIRGISPTSPVITIGRAEIASSGYTSVGSFLQALPENFRGGQNPGVVGVEGVNGGVNPISESSSPNLRGIGSDSTLSLVNGHRMGFDGGGENVDISLIPLAAVDRIEVVTDGASAIYGSDAVAGVVNVILRKSYDGAQTQATVGGPTGGGGFQQQYSQLLGGNFDRGGVIAAFEYNRTDPLLAIQRDFSVNALSPLNLLAAQKQGSAFLSGNYQLRSGLKLQAIGLYSAKSNFTQENVFGAVTTLAGHVHQYVADGSADYAFGSDGDASLNVNVAENDQRLLETDFDPTGGPPALTPETLDSRSESGELKVQLPSVDLSTGDLRAVLGAGYRQEHLEEINGSAPGSYSRGIAYAFGEAYAPLVKPSLARLGLSRLDLDASVRYESYEKIGTTTNPKVGVIYYPAPDFSLNATWGTSFRAPSLEQIHQPFTTGLFPGSIFGPPVPPDQTVLFAFGPSPNLKPETSTSWTVSGNYRPSWISGLTSTLTYYDTEYRKRITNPIASPLSALSSPIFAPFITLDPDPALQQSYIQKGAFANNSGGIYDPYDVYALVLDGIANVARERISGIDALASYSWSSHIGQWTVDANASWLDFVRNALPGAPEERINGTVFNPPTFKLRNSINWGNAGWIAAVHVNYVSGETDTVAVPAAHVGSWTTFDLQAGYVFSEANRLANGLDLRLTALNVLNRAPPRLDQFSTLPFGVGFDAANASGLGRTVLATISKEW